ncbi:uncharacterized protein LOC117781271 [Drosophila innubila]|uniref:uncharacterized protein LOC117781271 n=1 Tax=Drosophila innubila TaxID=198719 RepID=UPI00148D8C04|nr:uncharacterized protein LOC117781271 [Drosophila innubila]
MSINKLNLLLLQLLLIVNLGIGCWARPKWQQQQDAALNEVTSQEVPIAAEQIPNNLIEELSALRSPRGYYKKRRSFYKTQAVLQHSQIRGRFYNVPADGYPEVGVIPPGGANYYSNEVLPLSTYEIYEPETMYY